MRQWLPPLAATAALTLLFSACSDDESESPSSSDVNGSDAGTTGSRSTTLPSGPQPSDAAVEAPYAANGCIAAKQIGAGAYCRNVLEAFAAWAGTQDDSARDDRIADARALLAEGWNDAETAAADDGADCADAALTAEEAADQIDASLSSVVSTINDTLSPATDDACSARLLAAAAAACHDALVAEATHIADLASDADGATRDATRSAALDAMSEEWNAAATDGCSSDPVTSALSATIDELVANTIVAPHLDDGQFTTLSPTGTTPYMGKDLTPVCMDGSPYHFFAKRGTVNKVVMYYQGGGACWEDLTCSVPTCDPNVNLDDGRDNPNMASTGFGDRDNPDNPFRDWHQVFISYCSCDIHFGDAAQDYPTHVEHRGYHNARYAEKWAREHFYDPEEVFVTGSSAGSYGALFNGALLHDTWPASQFHVLGDAGNGVITSDFLNNELSNWNFIDNLPSDIPGVLEALSGEGMVGYMESIAKFYPDTNWGHYSTAFDGGSGGQTGFYNVMLNGNDPIAALTWWEGSCAFNSQMRTQAIDTYGLVDANYRYYIGTGARHTMWGSDKVYDDTTGGVPTIRDWIGAMLRSGPDGRDAAWTNVECENCGLLLPGDPVPDPLEPPFELQGSDTVIVCP